MTECNRDGMTAVELRRATSLLRESKALVTRDVESANKDGNQDASSKVSAPSV